MFFDNLIISYVVLFNQLTAEEGGKLCAYKAKAASIKEEMDGITALVPEYEVFPLAVPGLEDSERNLVVITK